MQIIKNFDKLYRQKKQIMLLNWAYWVIIAVSVIIAAFLAIFNQSLGVAVLIIPIICLIAICLNMFVWRIVEDTAKKKTKSTLYKTLQKIDNKLNKQDAKRYSKSSR